MRTPPQTVHTVHDGLDRPVQRYLVHADFRRYCKVTKCKFTSQVYFSSVYFSSVYFSTQQCLSVQQSPNVYVLPADSCARVRWIFTVRSCLASVRVVATPKKRHNHHGDDDSTDDPTDPSSSDYDSGGEEVTSASSQSRSPSPIRKAISSARKVRPPIITSLLFFTCPFI